MKEFVAGSAKNESLAHSSAPKAPAAKKKRNIGCDEVPSLRWAHLRNADFPSLFKIRKCYVTSSSLHAVHSAQKSRPPTIRVGRDQEETRQNQEIH